MVHPSHRRGIGRPGHLLLRFLRLNNRHQGQGAYLLAVDLQHFRHQLSVPDQVDFGSIRNLWQGHRLQGSLFLAQPIREEFFAAGAGVVFQIAGGLLSGLYSFHLGQLVAKNRDFGLRFQNFLANGAMLAIRQAGLGAGGIIALVDNLGMTLCGDFLLGNQDFLANGAMLALGLTRLGAGRLHLLVDYFRMSQSGDDLRLHSGSLIALVVLETIATNPARVVSSISRFSASRRLGIMQDHGVAQCVHRLLLYRGLPLPRRIQEGLFAGGAEVVCMVAQGRAGSRRLLMLFHRVPQRRDGLRLDSGQLGPLRILGGLLADRAVVVLVVALLCAGGGLFGEMGQGAFVGAAVYNFSIS